MNWLNCGVTTQAEWPSSRKEVKFGDHMFVLLPRTKEYSASIHIELTGISSNHGLTLVNRFLSSLSWKCDAPAINHYGWSGSPELMPVPRHDIPFGYSPFDHFPSELIEIDEEKAKLAVALYRDGRSLDSVPFQFLSYFKILNIIWTDSKKNGVNLLVAGLKSVLDDITDNDAIQRINEIQKDHGDPAHYLYKSGRCAVAHAFSDPVVDPDDIDDVHRLSKDLWLMQQVAKLAIEKQFNIEQSIWK
ncbi:MAG: hypothetical protein PWQ06_2503 [Anaerophaga sp.]|jgi:hypothetical protein|nr:hypothetical protein [Anaerophaga sp.]